MESYTTYMNSLIGYITCSTSSSMPCTLLTTHLQPLTPEPYTPIKTSAMPCIFQVCSGYHEIMSPNARLLNIVRGRLCVHQGHLLPKGPVVMVSADLMDFEVSSLGCCFIDHQASHPQLIPLRDKRIDSPSSIHGSLQDAVRATRTVAHR